MHLFYASLTSALNSFFYFLLSQVFNASNSTDSFAATIHIYTIVNTGGINNNTISYRAPEFLSSAWQFPLAQHYFLKSTIPQRHKLWVTEMVRALGRSNSARELQKTTVHDKHERTHTNQCPHKH